MPAIDLYYMDISPPCRSVRLLGKALGIDFQLHEVDIFGSEHLRSEFISINPLHTVPTIKDDEFVLWESRAILSYLVEQYGENDALYPRSPEARAQIDKLLYFDLTVLTHRFGAFSHGVFQGKRKPEHKQLEDLDDAFDMLDKMLEGHFFVASNRVSIADYALIAIVNTCIAVGIDIRRHNNISLWVQRCRQQMPGFDQIEPPAMDKLAKMTKSIFRVAYRNNYKH